MCRETGAGRDCIVKSRSYIKLTISFGNKRVTIQFNRLWAQLGMFFTRSVGPERSCTICKLMDGIDTVAVAFLSFLGVVVVDDDDVEKRWRRRQGHSEKVGREVKVKFFLIRTFY